MQCEYDSERAKVSNVKTFAPVLAPGAGAAVVDSGDRLWSVQGGALVQYAPHGDALRRIGMAREAAAGVAFGGEGLRQLLVLGANGGLYGLPPDLAPDLARASAPNSPADLARHALKGVPDVPFDDGGRARFAVLQGPSIGD